MNKILIAEDEAPIANLTPPNECMEAVENFISKYE